MNMNKIHLPVDDVGKKIALDIYLFIASKTFRHIPFKFKTLLSDSEVLEGLILS